MPRPHHSPLIHQHFWEPHTLSTPGAVEVRALDSPYKRRTNTTSFNPHNKSLVEELLVSLFADWKRRLRDFSSACNVTGLGSSRVHVQLQSVPCPHWSLHGFPAGQARRACGAPQRRPLRCHTGRSCLPLLPSGRAQTHNCPYKESSRVRWPPCHRGPHGIILLPVSVFSSTDFLFPRSFGLWHLHLPCG